MNNEVNSTLDVGWLITGALVTKHLFAKTVPIATGPAFRTVLATMVFAAVIEGFLKKGCNYLLRDKYLFCNSLLTGKTVVTGMTSPAITLFLLKKCYLIPPLTPPVIVMMTAGFVALGILMRFKPSTLELFNRDFQSINWREICLKHRKADPTVPSPLQVIPMRTTHVLRLDEATNNVSAEGKALQRDVAQIVNEATPEDIAIMSEADIKMRESALRVAVAGQLQLESHDVQALLTIVLPSNDDKWTMKRTCMISLLEKNVVVVRGYISLIYEKPLEAMEAVPTKVEIKPYQRVSS
jgi:hypothetical protein